VLSKVTVRVDIFILLAAITVAARAITVFAKVRARLRINGWTRTSAGLTFDFGFPACFGLLPCSNIAANLCEVSQQLPPVFALGFPSQEARSCRKILLVHTSDSLQSDIL
jgi:hypothetical protein